MTTTFLGLDLPIVSTTIGPTWASKVNAAFDVIDLHDHSNGKGVQIPTSGLNINANLDFGQYRISNLQTTQFASNSSTLTGSSNANSVYAASGDLYYTNSSGTAVQITSGASVVTSAGALQTVEVQSVSSNLLISPSDTFVYLTVNTTASRSITLPLANSVASGRVYIIKDISGQSNANNITLNKQGSDTIDGASSATLNSNYGSWWVVGDGVSSWYIS